MIDTQKLVKYIEQAPFPKAEKKRLITLACVADEEHKRHIYVLVKEFTDRIEKKKKSPQEEVQMLQLNTQAFRREIRKKGEALYSQTENLILADLETQFSAAT